MREVKWKKVESLAQRIARQAQNTHVKKHYLPDWVIPSAFSVGFLLAVYVFLWLIPQWAVMTVMRAEAYCKQPEPLNFFAACTGTDCFHCDELRGCLPGPYMISSEDPLEIVAVQSDLCSDRHIYVRLLAPNTSSQPEEYIPDVEEKETTNERLFTLAEQTDQH